MITKEELDIVREAVVDGIKTANDRMVDSKTKQMVAGRLLEWMIQFNASRIFTADGIRQLTAYVFGDAVFRDYILNLCASVLCRVPGQDNLIGRINKHLASSYLLYVLDHSDNGSRDSSCAIPTEITGRSVSLDDAVQVLSANQWLTVMILVREFYSPNVRDLQP